MPQITIDMNEYEQFFQSELGQAVLNEMAKSEKMGEVSAAASYIHTSKDTLAFIVKRLTESANYESDGALCVVLGGGGISKADTKTLDEIYAFAMKLMDAYEDGYTPHRRMAMKMLDCLAIHSNTSEETLHKLLEYNAVFYKFVVRNPGISDKWLIELVESATSQDDRLAAVPELLRRLKARQQE